jgi:hypothetical protein
VCRQVADDEGQQDEATIEADLISQHDLSACAGRGSSAIRLGRRLDSYSEIDPTDL